MASDGAYPFYFRHVLIDEIWNDRPSVRPCSEAAGYPKKMDTGECQCSGLKIGEKE